MNSKYFKVGALVDIKTSASLRAQAKLTILEVLPMGIIVQNRGGREYGKATYFPFDQIEVEFHPAKKDPDAEEKKSA